MEDFNPYESPRVVDSPSVRSAVGWGGVFVSAHTRAVFAMSLLGITIFTSLLVIYSTWMQYSLFDQAKHGKRFPMEVAQASDARYIATGGGELIVRVLTAIAFLMWTYRVYKNLPALGASGLEHTPGWAVGWYFVPIANLVKPYSVTVEIARHSNPEGLGANARAIGTANVGWWWAAFIISGILGRIAAAIIAGGGESHSLDATMTGFSIAIVAEVISIIAAVLAILLVAQVDKNQERRFQIVSEQTNQPSQNLAGRYPFLN